MESQRVYGVTKDMTERLSMHVRGHTHTHISICLGKYVETSELPVFVIR